MYSEFSPFNTKAPSRPRVHPQSSRYIGNLFSVKKQFNNISIGVEPTHDYRHPVFRAEIRDPTYLIDCPGYALDKTGIPVPTRAIPTASEDAHMTIVNPAGTWEYDLWGAFKELATRQLRCKTAYRQRYDGLGITPIAMMQEDPTIGGGTAANFGASAGIITAEEFLWAAEDGQSLNHVLFAVAAYVGNDTEYGYGVMAPGTAGHGGAGSAVYPAIKGDAAARGWAPMGARMWLEWPFDRITASGAPLWEQALAKTMNKYGLIIGDTGGGGIGVQFESDRMYEGMGIPNPYETVCNRLRIPKEPEYGYTFKWSGKIPYSTAMRVIV